MMTVQTFEVNYFSENTYVLQDEETKEAVIVDCGALGENEKLRIASFIARGGLVLKRNLCTHLHLDHIFGNDFIKKTYGIAPEANEADEAGLPDAEEQARAFGLPVVVPAVPLRGHLSEGDVVRFGKSELKVLAVPGHSPGGLAFYSPADNLVLTGDSLFAGSVGRTDLWGGNHQALISAIREKLLTLPDETKVYPGHGPATTIGKEKKNNPYI